MIQKYHRYGKSLGMPNRDKPTDPHSERMLHIRLDAEVHRNLRIIAAADDVSLQELVSSMLSKATAQRVEKNSGAKIEIKTK